MAQAHKVLVFGNAGAGLVALRNQLAPEQSVETVAHFGFGQRHHRIPAGELIAAGHDCVHRQGIVVGRDERLLDHDCEHADLDWIQIETFIAVGGGCTRSGFGHRFAL